jgi:membrane-associated protein
MTGFPAAQALLPWRSPDPRTLVRQGSHGEEARASMVEVVESLLASPWIYLCILVVSALDGLFPFLPSDTTIVAASVASAHGRPSAVLIALAGGVGVALGDEVGYWLGHRMGSGSWRLRGRSMRVYTWAARTLGRRGILLISGARYIPFGRVATILAAGATGYPKLRFTLISWVSAFIWSGSLVMLGYCSAKTFAADPLIGLLVAGLVVIVASVLIRLAYRRIRNG